jgi:hypothetical protein
LITLNLKGHWENSGCLNCLNLVLCGDSLTLLGDLDENSITTWHQGFGKCRGDRKRALLEKSGARTSQKRKDQSEGKIFRSNSPISKSFLRSVIENQG